MRYTQGKRKIKMATIFYIESHWVLPLLVQREARKQSKRAGGLRVNFHAWDTARLSCP